MPRSGATYSLPAGNPVTTLSIISSTWANTTMSDIATALTNSAALDGSGLFTGSIKAPDGAAGTPGFTFASETGTGLYKVAAGQLGFALATAVGAVLRIVGGVTQFGTTGASGFALMTNGVAQLSISAGGNLTAPAPTSGDALTLNVVAGGNAITMQNAGAVGVTTLYSNSAGTLSIGITNLGTSQVVASGALQLLVPSSKGISIASSGAVSVLAPTSGVALTVNAVGAAVGLVINGSGTGGSATALVSNAGTNQFAALFQGSATTSFGVQINAGTGAADQALQINTQGGSRLLTLFGDGGVTIGAAPTGGDQGIGTVNVSGGFFINGVAVGGQGTFSARKPATTGRTLTTTLTNDPDLALAIATSGVYVVEALIATWNTAGAANGISANLNYNGTFSTNAAGAITVLSGSGSLAAFTGQISATVNNPQVNGSTSAGAATPTMLLYKATLTATGAGTLAVAWAQSASNATASNVGAGSYITATKIA